MNDPKRFPQYSLQEAGTAVRLSYLAYFQRGAFPVSRDAIGVQKSVLIDSGSCECLVSLIDSEIWIAFRGTETPEISSSFFDSVRNFFTDGLRDIRVLKRQLEGVPGKVHAGFASSIDEILPELLELLTEWKTEDTVFHLCGHSKGAAEAILCAAWLVNSGVNSIGSVHGFGCPAVGDLKFARWYDSKLKARTFIHSFESDIVSRSPIILRGLRRYATVGNMIHHNRDKSSGFLRLRYFLNSLGGFRRSKGLRDHRIHNYIESLKA